MNKFTMKHLFLTVLALFQGSMALHALGDLDRMIHRRRQADDAMPDMDAGRAARQIGEKSLRRAHMGILRQRGVFDRPDAVEIEAFRQQALLDHVVEHLEFGFRRRIDGLRFINNRKLHCRFPPDEGPVGLMAMSRRLPQHCNHS